ncbi:putative methyltransferase DDB_G0268948 [Brienomyrus brachyistius]|uniref:putative methyltransferase DDB_G0268948 n=1 Tax=Brienomyrus brachyistius TaxID=42636 RepID=UPI0020B4173E|nr:putative methyltransferase DDB_G0268948 [Brienomyrus brachyistius]XP_048866389.1 putative methyltransferase DDB_G0268948 [Brienomyrus brachyistius]XP_048866398.1 putative methyltransferase DDB_G0268948 [Brienomyrus brachyistius]XP_048866405.1 putative methyltransferase DDB_G0268948 [Brienomyrus brachyistius]XP_048866412.1 putative methyltransferase DDB_G0268948 [Brienomyrus brachyistius]XP_048866414.1 putative methyltransferase DDB_G0268948 [Brienomyrus brachyistius]XP_048866418.1 putative
MAFRLFEEKHHASIYQRYRFVPPNTVKELILQYLDEKKGQPHVLAVDLGCGTGQNSRRLAPHFQEVVGIDVSESQIEEARAVPGFSNVIYRVGTAEDLPFPDNSVDLLTAASAAHWFNQEGFLKEACRTLKPKGCIALFGYTDQDLELHYGSCGDRLICIYEQTIKSLSPYVSKRVALANSKLLDLFDAIPFPDKKRIDCIPVEEDISVSNVLGFLETFSYYQAYKKAEPEAASALLRDTQAKLLEAMGVSSPETKMKIRLVYFCVLACKTQ